MNSLQETQLGRDLHQLASGQPFAPDLEAIGRQARRRHHRGRVVRGAAGAGAAVVAAGGLFAAVHGAGAPAAGTTAATKGTAVPAQRTETVAYVSRQVMAALADVNSYVLRDDQAQTGSSPYSATIWTDPRTGNAYEVLNDSTAGKSLAWMSTYLVNRVLTWKTVEADYSTKTWSVSIMHAAGPVQGSTAGLTSTVMTPAEIKQWLDSGKLTIIGRKTVNGHQAIGLRGPWARGYREMWVDSQTFLPLRFVYADFANESGPSRNVQIIGNDTWLPRTASLLGTVNSVHIPAGFRQVAPPK